MFFESVIFDLDNTLYDYEACHNFALTGVLRYVALLKKVPLKTAFNAYNTAKESIKFELDGTAASHNKFLYFKKMSELLSLDNLILNKKYWLLFLKKIELRPGALGLLKFLNSRDIKVHLLTDFSAEYQHIKLKKLKILPYIKTITTSEEIGAEKPSSKIFLCCLEKIKTPINKILLIGDSYSKDIMGAIKRGIFPVWLNSKKPFAISRNFLICPNFKELLNFFLDLDLELARLEVLSKYCGERFDLVQSGGGNISVKINKLMAIKASGYSLSDVSKTDGYTILNNGDLKTDLSKCQYSSLNDYNIFSGHRASMEAYMHSILKKYTLHLHPLQVNILLIKKRGGALMKELFPESLVIDYEMPGINTCKKLINCYKNEKIIFIINHGIIITSDSYNELIGLIESILTTCEKMIDFDFKKYKEINRISMAVNATSKKPFVVKLSEDSILKELLIDKQSSFKAVFPDKTIFCGINFFKSERVSGALIKSFIKKNKDIPRIVITGGEVYTVASTLSGCNDIESILKAHLLILKNSDDPVFLTHKDESSLKNLEAEKYRKTIQGTRK